MKYGLVRLVITVITPKNEGNVGSGFPCYRDKMKLPEIFRDDPMI